MELTPSAPLLAHYSEYSLPASISSPVLPIATPIAGSNLDQMPSLNIPPLHTCNSCNSSFNRKEKDKGSSAYFRCLSCQQKMLQMSIIQNCIIH